jgi:Protein of unknown function (DUF4038)/Putative collagen-binding domain of a collagenase
MKLLFAKIIFIGYFLNIACVLFSQDNRKHGRLQVTANGHYLQYEDGTPFFWLGDTGWELFHRLNKEEIEKYLENRRQKGFNVIQSVILAEFNGLKKPNQYGDVPLNDLDPEKPNEKYFELVDWVIQNALSKNIFMGLLPTWGDKVTLLWGEGPVVFNEHNAYGYGLFLGKRYAAYPNIIWILGGDRPAVKDSNDWRPVWRAMAKGIKEGTNGNAIFSYHTWGGENSTSQYIHKEAWLQINMMQSGHGGGHDVPVWKWIERDRKMQPSKPTLDSEPNYEDHPVNPWPKWDPANGYFRDYDVRKQIYRSVFAGGCGVTYGHHAVWQFWSEREEKINYADRYWTEAIDRPGAFQAGYLKKLMDSRPALNRIPDQEIIASGQGEKGAYITAFRSDDSTYAMIYLPIGKKIEVNTAGLKSGKLSCWWFNPKDAASKKIGVFKRKNIMAFTPPTTGIENDWVLILDDARKKWLAPGL